MNMTCPSCNKPLTVHDAAHVRRNIDAYHRAVTVKATCCGTAVMITPYTRLSADVVLGEVKCDFFGEHIPAR